MSALVHYGPKSGIAAYPKTCTKDDIARPLEMKEAAN
jgi:hypothetical protein